MMRFVTLLGFVLMGAEAANAQSPHVLGSWKLNLTASDMPDWLSRDDELRSCALREDGYMLARSIDRIDRPRIAPDAPVPIDTGSDCFAPSIGSLTDPELAADNGSFIYSEQTAGERTVTITGRTDGQVTARGTRSISADGGTMTIDVTLIQGQRQLPIVLVFDRE